MRFQDAARDARTVVYAGVQADRLVTALAALLVDATPAQLLLARAVMNGVTTDPSAWRAMVPACFPDPHAEAILAASLEVAERGDDIRSQFRGAIVEALTELLLVRRVAARGGPRAAVRRERRILFDGVRSEIHPYDVTVELPDAPATFDCKWSARGIGDDVLVQLDAARANAAADGITLRSVLVVFDSRLACAIRLRTLTTRVTGVQIVTIETVRRLGGSP